MLALALTITVFLFWFAIGLPLVWGFYSRRNLLQSALLAPAIGMVVTALLVIWASCFGFPIRYGGPVTSGIMVIVSSWLLYYKRPVVPLRRLVPFGIVLLSIAVTVGLPFLRFGFNWISYGNDDMANYTLGARLFLNHGEFEIPDAQAIVNDRDASLLYWRFYIPGAIRHGVEELLAWLSSVTGLTTLEAFMPLILAFHLVLVTSTAALVLQGRKQRRAALVTAIALGFSALTVLGTMYQLLGQVAGLAVLAAACAVLLRKKPRTLSESLIAGLLLGGAGALYPEILPFVALSYLVYHSILLFRRKLKFKTIAVSLSFAALFAAAFLNVTILVAASTVLNQVVTGTTSMNAAGASVFPYYLTPAGFAYLWGLRAIGQREIGYLLDLEIVVGGLLLLIVMVAALRYVWSGSAVAAVLIVMFITCVELFRLRVDFGLYKIAMYLQPFLLGTLSVLITSALTASRPFVLRLFVVATVGTLICGAAQTEARYILLSFGDKIGAFVEVPYASRDGLATQLSELSRQNGAMVSDTQNPTLGKLESLYHGSVYFTVKDFFVLVASGVPRVTALNLYWKNYEPIVRHVEAERNSHFDVKYFDMNETKESELPSQNRFATRRDLWTYRDLHVLTSGSRVTVLNRNLSSFKEPLVRIADRNKEKNRLMFVDSEFGAAYGSSTKSAEGKVSIYPVESDYFYKDGAMAGLGRIALFGILNPSSHVCMEVEYTASLNGDKANRIPPLNVVGDRRLPFPAEGRGSGRLFSPCVPPQLIDGWNYVALDMGTWGLIFPQTRSRIMSLWGQDVLTDSRRIVGFARNISLVSEEEYAALERPSAVQWFPDDLARPALEYSGIYEDGWIAESGYVVLRQSDGAHPLVVSLAIPVLDGKRVASWCVLEVDGREVARQSITSDAVSFKVAVDKIGDHRIRLRFDRAASLADPDGRPVSAHINYAGFRAP